MPTTNAAADAITYLQQAVLLPRETRALVDPMEDPRGTPAWAEVELRVTAAAAGDPDALCYPAEKGVTREHALRMVTAAHSRHTLVARDHERGVSCYVAAAPGNPEELLDNPSSTPVLKEIARYSLTTAVTAVTPSGGRRCSITVELATPSAGGGEPAGHTVVADTLAEGVAAALSWIYDGYPLTTGRPGVYPRTPPGLSAPPLPPSRPSLLCALGWVLRYAAAYGIAALGIACATAAAAHAWLHGLYAEELLDILRGMALGACGGTVAKYAGVALMRGLQGVANELSRGGD